MINAGRQVGGALGVAVLGALAATLTRADWHSRLSLLGPEARANAVDLTPLVLAGQDEVVGGLAGRPAEVAWLASFAYGLRGALLGGSVLVLVAAAVAAIGLHRPRRRGASWRSKRAAPPVRAT